MRQQAGGNSAAPRTSARSMVTNAVPVTRRRALGRTPSIEMVRQAKQSRSRAQDLAIRAALWLTRIALGAGSTTLVVWLNTEREFSLHSSAW